LIEKDGDCPRCHGGNEHVEAIDFAVRRFEDWHREGRLTDRQWQTLSDIYARERRQAVAAAQAGRPDESPVKLPRRDQCWNCKETVAGPSYCESCGATMTGPAVKSLRFFRFLWRELDHFEQDGTITLRQSHDLIGETRERLAALKSKLDRDRVPVVAVVSTGQGRAAAVPRRSPLEVLLDPRSIQWLLGSGGGLLVIGLVIWLSSLGVFDNPGVVAAALGAANAVLLLGGWALTLGTRYQTPGRALTLLACLVMPLNLWFYHLHGLLTLEGHLWVAAVVCCVIYAASAVMLKDPVFAYVLVGGVTLTGLLILGDLHKLDEIYAPSALLVVLALVCLHAERAFPPTDGPFSRRRFGMAFYWSAHALLAAGLFILLLAQTLGWLHEPLLRHLGMVKPVVARPAYLPWTLALVLAATYAYVYSDLVVRRIGVYIYLAAITLLWAEVQILVQLDTPHSQSIVIVTLALTALAANVLQVTLQGKREFLRTAAPLGVMLSLLPVLFGVLLHFRQTNVVLHDLWPFEISWPYVGAMAITALCCRAGAFLYRRESPGMSAFYFFATAAATLVFAAGLVWMIGFKAWEVQSLLLMAIPIAYLVAAHLYRGDTAAEPLVWCAHASTAVMLASSLYVAAGIPQVREIAPITGDAANLLLAVFCLETALFYGLAAALRKEGWNVYLATAMLCGAIWQLLAFFHTPHEVYPLAFGLLGLALLIAYRLAILEQWEWAGLARAGFQCANALTTLGSVAGLCLSLSRLFTGQIGLAHIDAAGDWHGPVRLALYVMLFLAVVSLLAAWLVRQQDWRRVYLVAAAVDAGMALLLFYYAFELPFWRALEVFSVLVGLVLLVLGHVGWYRETEERFNENVGFALFFGSLALLAPLAIATVVNRFGFQISVVDEVGLVFACVALLGSGIICRLKATTLFGSVTLVLYLLMVLIYLHRFLHQQAMIGLYIGLGGAVLFGTGLVLGVFRDRLLSLPERFKRHEGIFRVFGWR
jgi:hypothetical protein